MATEIPTEAEASGLDARREQRHLASMPKRKEPELTPAEQFKRFKEAAKKAGVSDKEEVFERDFEKVARAKIAGRATRKS